MNKRFLYFTVLIFSTLIASITIGCGDLSPTTPQNDRPQTTLSAIQETPTLVLATLTKTPALLPFFAQTHIATLEVNDIELIIPSMFNICDLPCWGQIIPGITSEISAKNFLSSFGSVGKKSVSFQYRTQSVVIDLTFKEGVVNSINLPPEITDFVRIKTLLTKYRAPEDIQLVVIPETAAGTPWFTLVLLYPQQGFFAMFSGEGVENNSKIDICPENISPDLYLLQPNTYSLSEINDIIFLILQQRLSPLEKITDTSVPKFAEIFRTETKKCLTTNLELP